MQIIVAGDLLIFT